MDLSTRGSGGFSSGPSLLSQTLPQVPPQEPAGNRGRGSTFGGLSREKKEEEGQAKQHVSRPNVQIPAFSGDRSHSLRAASVNTSKAAIHDRLKGGHRAP